MVTAANEMDIKTLSVFLINPAVLVTHVGVVANRGEPSVAYLPDGRVFNLRIHDFSPVEVSYPKH